MSGSSYAVDIYGCCVDFEKKRLVIETSIGVLYVESREDLEALMETIVTVLSLK